MDTHNHAAGLSHAPAWGMWVGSIGGASIIAALILFTLSFLLSFNFRPPILASVRRWTFMLGCAAFVVAFGSLVSLFVGNQFQFEYVFGHGDTDTALKYKIAGTWTAQEGSFLLWAVWSAVFGFFTVRKAGQYEPVYTAVFAIFLAVLAAILLKETPFKLIPALIEPGGASLLPERGRGMTPSLQNYWVVIHPPVIFAGFGALTVPFAYSIASMLGRDHFDWVSRCRAIVLFAVSVLGVGICLGGLWAYETLGWGGFWMWDPVENASFVPWLFLAALAHAFIATSAKRAFGVSTHLLAGLPFLAFVYGTFLTRSGLLDGVSVHSFASMDKSALGFLRWFMIVAFVAFFALLAWKYRALQQLNRGAKKGGRASYYSVGNQLLSILGLIIGVGMSWPVLSVWIKDSKLAGKDAVESAIQEPVYHQAVVWLFIPIMILMAVAPYASWKRESVANLGGKLITCLSASIALTGGLIILFKHPVYGVGLLQDATIGGPVKNSSLPLVYVAAGLTLLCIFSLVSNGWRIVQVFKRSKLGTGAFVAHIGIAVLMAGLIISRAFEREDKIFVREGAPSSALGYTVAYNKLTGKDSTDRDTTVVFDVAAPDGSKFQVAPGMYYYEQNEEQKSMVWPYIKRGLTHDLYFSLRAPSMDLWEQPMSIKPGETQTKNQVTVKYLKPVRKGEAGTKGVEFGAELEITYPNAENLPQTYKATPMLKVTDQGPMPDLQQVSPEFRAAVLMQRLEDRSILFQLFWSPPVYPIIVYYKPLASLVWVGIGLLMIGGFASAWVRRRSKNAPESELDSKDVKIDDADATLTTA